MREQRPCPILVSSWRDDEPNRRLHGARDAVIPRNSHDPLLLERGVRVSRGQVIEQVTQLLCERSGWTVSPATGRLEKRSCVEDRAPLFEVPVSLVDRMVGLGRSAAEIVATIAAFRWQADVDEMDQILMDMERRRG